MTRKYYVAKRIVLAIMAIPFVLHVAFSILALSGGSKDTIQIQSMEKNHPIPDYPFIDRTIDGMHVLGVKHSAEEFEKTGKHILSAIKEADVVLLENGEGYFDILMHAAKEAGKNAYIIDHPNLILLLLTIALPLVCIKEAMIALIRGKPWKIKTTIAAFAWILGFPGPMVYGTILQQSWLEKISIGYIEDGRTGLMIQRAHERCLERKCVVIMGQAHARAWSNNPHRYATNSPHMIFYRMYNALENI